MNALSTVLEHVHESTPEELSPGLDLETHRLTTAVARGDADAFGAFYEAWFDRAYAMARAITRRDESFCLDVVQDAMMRVVRSLRPMPHANALAYWMARVVRTTALDRLKQESRRVRRELAVAERNRRSAEAGSRPAAVELEERAAWLDARLRELSEEERTLLVERFDRGKSLEEAGAVVGLSGNAASGRIGRAISRLKSMAREVFRD